jgi:carbamoyl-phosphate synthase/aspartate carbamoyltransferase/dihydroorotase
MTTLRLPGLIDVHTHMRDPGEAHKEDWASGTAAALAGGFTTVLAMPNTRPPVVDRASLDDAFDAAGRRARCDYGQFVGAGEANAEEAAALAPEAVGLKMYLDSTFGGLRLGGPGSWRRHLEAWPADRPIALHAEGPTLDAALTMAAELERPVHVCHLSTEQEMFSVLEARHRGLPVTCEVAPHHLFLDRTEMSGFAGRASVRPPLASPADREALWRHLDDIDCFATDHAPHTIAEKSTDSPPPGFPGLETALPLFIGAVHDGLLTIDDVVARLHDGPRRIFGLDELDAAIEVDAEASWVVDGEAQQTRAGWTPFEGRVMRGRVARVVVRGVEVYRDGEVLAAPGSGRNLRTKEQ